MVAGVATAQLFEWRMGAVEEVGECRFAGSAAHWRRMGAPLAAGLAREVHDDLRRAGLDAHPGRRRHPARPCARPHRRSGRLRRLDGEPAGRGPAPARASPPSSAPTCTRPSAGTSGAWSSGSSTPPCRDRTAVLGAGRTLEALEEPPRRPSAVRRRARLPLVGRPGRERRRVAAARSGRGADRARAARGRRHHAARGRARGRCSPRATASPRCCARDLGRGTARDARGRPRRLVVRARRARSRSSRRARSWA